MNKERVEAPADYVGADHRASFKVGVGGHAHVEVEGSYIRQYEDKDTGVTRPVCYLMVTTIGSTKLTRNNIEEEVPVGVPLNLKMHGSLAKELLSALRARNLAPVMTREQFVEWARNIDEEVKGVWSFEGPKMLNTLTGEKFFIRREADAEGEGGRKYSRYVAKVAPLTAENK